MICAASSPDFDLVTWKRYIRGTFRSAVCLLCTLLLATTASARQRTFNEAEREAHRLFLAKGVDTKKVMLTSAPAACYAQARALRTTVNRQDEPFYIFDSADGKAFVVVAGDSRMTTLLGWSDASAFPTDDVPKGLAWLLDFYACQHALLNTPEFLEMGDSTVVVFDDFPMVDPILRTRWGQGIPFNGLCPMKGSSYSYTGCVATAMAQILYLYRQPTIGANSFAYISTDEGFPCSFDFGATTFDWNHMRLDYSGRYTDDERLAVAELMYACGVSVAMNYTTSGSGAYSEDVPYALHHFFGYNPYSAHYSRDYFPEYEWHRIICDELKEGRPVLYCGAKSETAGHAFVVDGCDGKGLYHINWGWSGSADGFFSLDNLAPYGGDAYGMWQDIVCRISPDTVGTYEDIFFADEIVVQDGPIALGDTLHIEVLEVGCTNSTFSSIDSTLCFTGTVGIGLYDDKMEFVQWLDIPDTISANLYTIYKLWYEIPMDADVFTNEHVWWLVPAAQDLETPRPFPMHLLNTTRDKVPLYVYDGVAHIGAQSLDHTEVSVLPAEQQPAIYYDLQGRPCRQPGKGIYMFNGEKRVF